MTPLELFRRFAIAEAVTWTLLLAGMFAKYVTETTDLGVQVFGLAHGVVFLAYCLVTIVVGIDQQWSTRRLLVGLAAAVPPLATIPFDRSAERAGVLGATWRLRGSGPDPERGSPGDRGVAWLVNEPGRAGVLGVVLVAALTGLALVIGPPTG